MIDLINLMMAREMLICSAVCNDGCTREAKKSSGWAGGEGLFWRQDSSKLPKIRDVTR